MKSFRSLHCQAAIAAAVVVLSAAPLVAQARYNVHFRSAEVTGIPGGTVSLGIGVDNTPQAVTGFSFGVKHDAAKVSVQSVTIAPELQAILGAGVVPDSNFFHVNTAPQGGAGFTLAIILSGASATPVSIPAGADHPVFDATYKIAASAAEPITVEITGDLGNPKVPVILDLKGVAQAPTGTPGLTAAAIRVGSGPPPFVRGDADQNGRFQVTDAIIIIDFLFGSADMPAGINTYEKCAVCMNVDGSTGSGTPDVEDLADINLTDPIDLLRYIFPPMLPPVEPAAPFPTCGQAPGQVAAEIACTQFVCH